MKSVIGPAIARENDSLPAALQFSQQESFLRHRRWQRERALELLGGPGAVAAAQPQLAEGGIEQWVITKRIARCDRFDCRDSGIRSVGHRDCDRTIERHDR